MIDKIYSLGNYVFIEFENGTTASDSRDDVVFLNKTGNNYDVISANIGRYSFDVTQVKNASDSFYSKSEFQSWFTSETGDGATGTESKSRGWVWVRDDTLTDLSPLSLLDGVETLLPLNDDFIFQPSPPLGLTANDFFDFENNKITPIFEGEQYILRFKFNVLPVLNNRNLTVDITVNGSIIYEKTFRLARGAGTVTTITETVFLFVGSSFKTNGAQIKITCDGVASLYSPNYALSRL